MRMRSWVCLTLIICASCSRENRVVAPSPANTNVIMADAALFQLVTQTEPFGSYTLFPNVEAVISSSTHPAMVQVSVNAKALGALQNGKLPSGTPFPDGSIIFKDIRTSAGVTTTYAVMYKERNNPLAGSGWLWAELSPSGSVAYSITNRGAACTSCHSREQGPQNDLVRTFERQR